jgi:tRNA A-37 threonylcarbamoyl transferase component Bud32
MKVLEGQKIGPAIFEISASLPNSECKGRLIVMEDVGEFTMAQFREVFEGYTFSLFQKIVEIGALVLKQLEELHKLGFVHGDIHAKNIALNVYPRQSVRLIDFGLTDPYVTDWGHHVENKKKKSSADDFGFSKLKILSRKLEISER